MLTQKRLKELLHYDPETGIFTRIKKTSKVSNKRHIGERAGFINEKGYVRIKIEGFGYLAHRLAWLYMNGEFPNGHIDHINRQRADNRISNLREATFLMNAGNAKSNNDFVGVFWNKAANKWQAYIEINTKKKHLGHYKTHLAACYARHLANLEAAC